MSDKTIAEQIQEEVDRLTKLDTAIRDEDERQRRVMHEQDMAWMVSVFQEMFGVPPESTDMETMRMTQNGIVFGGLMDDDGYVKRRGICRVVPCKTCGELLYSHPLSSLEDVARFEMNQLFYRWRWHTCTPTTNDTTPYEPQYTTVVVCSPEKFAERSDQKIKEGWTLFSTTFILDDDGYTVMGTFTRKRNSE